MTHTDSMPAISTSSFCGKDQGWAKQILCKLGSKIAPGENTLLFGVWQVWHAHLCKCAGCSTTTMCAFRRWSLTRFVQASMHSTGEGRCLSGLSDVAPHRGCLLRSLCWCRTCHEQQWLVTPACFTWGSVAGHRCTASLGAACRAAEACNTN